MGWIKKLFDGRQVTPAHESMKVGR